MEAESKTLQFDDQKETTFKDRNVIAPCDTTKASMNAGTVTGSKQQKFINIISLREEPKLKKRKRQQTVMEHEDVLPWEEEVPECLEQSSSDEGNLSRIAANEIYFVSV